MSQFLLNSFNKKYSDLKENVNKLYKDMLNCKYIILFHIAIKAGILSDDELLELAHEVADKWMELGSRLRIEYSILTVFHEEYERLPAYRMLTFWKQREGSAATYRVLHKALCDISVNRRDLAETFCGK